MKSYLRVLNLEDCAADAELNNAMISARWPHCDLTRVDNRKDYVAALEKEDFDIILSDFTMPNFDGMQALDLARKMKPQTPFLFVSGTIGEDTAIEALKNGAIDYVLKHRLVRLIPCVDRALREAREHAECERAEVALRESEHKYRELFESLNDVAFLVDEQTGKIIDTNRRAETLLGCSRGQILGLKQSDFLTLDANVSSKDAPANNKGGSNIVEGQLIKPDGGRIPVVAHANLLTLHNRPLVLWLCEAF